MSIYIQYQESPKLTALVNGITTLYSQNGNTIPKSYDIVNFRTNYYNIMLCNSDGLDNWGRILGVNRTQPFNIVPTKIFGFKDATSTSNPPPPITNFGYPAQGNIPAKKSNFYATQRGLNTLNDIQYRLLLLLAMQKYNSNFSLGSINTMLTNYFTLSFATQFLRPPDYTMTINVKTDILSDTEIIVTSTTPLYSTFTPQRIYTLSCVLVQGTGQFLSTVNRNLPIFLNSSGGVYQYILKLDNSIAQIYPIPTTNLAINVLDLTNIYCIPGNMTIAYRIPSNFIQAYERYIFDPINNLDILPRPNGVSVTVNFNPV